MPPNINGRAGGVKRLDSAAAGKVYSRPRPAGWRKRVKEFLASRQ
jgi:hypothetical protein